jgi:hypothetical protein
MTDLAAIDRLIAQLAENRAGFVELRDVLRSHGCAIDDILDCERSIAESDRMIVELYQHRRRAVGLLADGGTVV